MAAISKREKKRRLLTVELWEFLEDETRLDRHPVLVC